MNGPGFFQRKIIAPIKALLLQGITPAKISLSLAIGIVLGAFPVLGTTTILCTIVALVSRLNLPAMQIANWLSYPLQVLLLIPFYRMGEWLFQVPPINLAIADLIEMFQRDFKGSIAALWDTTLHGIVAWSLVAPVAGLVFYFTFLPLIRRFPAMRKDGTP